MANRVELQDANIQRVDTLEVLVATVISMGAEYFALLTFR